MVYYNTILTFDLIRYMRFLFLEGVRSAKFTEIVDPQTYKSIRLRPFRMHFQFLMANDRAGVFDIFALTLGPKSLRDRVLGEDASLLGAPAAAHA